MMRARSVAGWEKSRIPGISPALLLFLFVFAGTWTTTVLCGGQPPPPPGVAGQRPFPPGPPPREDGDFWESITGKALKPDDPLVIWRDALKDYRAHAKKLEGLSREQDDLSQQLRAETESITPGRPTLPAIPRMQERRRVISALHQNAQALEKEEQALRGAAKPVVEHAAEIAQRLGEIQQILEKKIADTSASGPTGRTRFLDRQKERVDSSIRLLEQVQADPDHGSDKVIDAFRLSALFIERRGGPGVMIQQIREQLENLEREQAFLKQRVENHEESLRMLRAQLDFLTRERSPQAKGGTASPDNAESSEQKPVPTSQK